MNEFKSQLLMENGGKIRTHLPTLSAKKYPSLTEYMNIDGWFCEKEAKTLQDACLTNMKPIPYVKYLEIGTYRGRSAMAVLAAIKNHGEMYLVDPCDQCSIPNISETPPLFNVMYLTSLFQNYKNIHLVVGKSEEIMHILKPDQFDIIFIDGDHGYESAKHDILTAMKLLNKHNPNARLFVHDSLKHQIFKVYDVIEDLKKLSTCSLHWNFKQIDNTTLTEITYK